jgi:hypothetical protein
MARVYVETTVWSFAFADDSPDLTRITLQFFDRCRAGLIAPVIGPVVFKEIDGAPEPVKSKLLGLIDRLSPEVLAGSVRADRLAQEFLTLGAVPPSKPDDAAHVAAAYVGECDVLVSWNFKHITNVRKAQKFNAAALLRGFRKPLIIVTPAEVNHGV